MDIITDVIITLPDFPQTRKKKIGKTSHRECMGDTHSMQNRNSRDNIH